MQGFGKFGFYEMFKDVYKAAFGVNAAKYQTFGFLLSSACAEVIADCFLAPMEAVSIGVLNSPLIFNNLNQIFIIMYYSSKLECKLLIKVPSPPASPRDSTKSRLMRESTASTRVSPHSG